MVNYSNGKIYKIVNDIDDKIYVGSTTQTLNKRFNRHKSKSKQSQDRTIYKHFNIIGWDHVTIKLIENYVCSCKYELEKRERYWIDTLNSSLNIIVPTRTQKEHYELNKDRILTYNRNYRLANIEKCKKRDRDYYIKNKQRILDRDKRYYLSKRDELATKVTCECGKVVSKSGLTAHKKTQKHIKIIST